MAYEVSFFCHECNLDRTAYISAGFPIPTICHECSQVVKEREKAEWLEAQRLKHTEVRLRELEEWMWESQHSVPLSFFHPPVF